MNGNLGLFEWLNWKVNKKIELKCKEDEELKRQSLFV
jgi:hypothetical protein